MELGSINSLERHILTCLQDACDGERALGHEGWLSGDWPPDWVGGKENLVTLGLVETNEQFFRISEQGESLLAQIDASEAVTH